MLLVEKNEIRRIKCLSTLHGYGRKSMGYCAPLGFFNRKLISEKDFNFFVKDIDIIGIKLNNYINSIGNGSKKSNTTNDSKAK